MYSNGHQPAPDEEAGWDAALLERWRDQLGHAGVMAIELLPGLPPVHIDLSGTTQLILQGRITSSFLRDGLLLRQRLDRTFQQASAEEPEAAGELQETLDSGRLDRHQELMAWYDALIAAVWVGPPAWCKLADIPRGARPPGQLCIHDIQPMGRLNMLIELIVSGADGLASFRDQSAMLAAASDGPRLRPAPEQLPDPDVSDPPAVLVRPGGLDAGDARGAGAPAGGEPADGARAARPDEHPDGA